jgi:hypothetical protein
MRKFFGPKPLPNAKYLGDREREKARGFSKHLTSILKFPTSLSEVSRQ